MSTQSVTLYTLVDDYQALLATSDSVTPEMQEQFLEDLSKSLVRQKDKVDSVSHFLAMVDSQIAAAKAEKARLGAFQEMMEAAKERVQDMVLRVIAEHNLKALNGNTTLFSRASNPPSVLIEDESKIPARFMDETVLQIPDKLLIKQAIARGETVTGADLIPGSYRLVRK